jgi:hypothetical protein
MPWFRKAPKNLTDNLTRFEQEIERLVNQMKAAGQERQALIILGERLQARLCYSDLCYRHDTALEYIMRSVVAVLKSSDDPPDTAYIVENLEHGRGQLIGALKETVCFNNSAGRPV